MRDETQEPGDGSMGTMHFTILGVGCGCVHLFPMGLWHACSRLVTCTAGRWDWYAKKQMAVDPDERFEKTKRQCQDGCCKKRQKHKGFATPRRKRIVTEQQRCSWNTTISFWAEQSLDRVLGNLANVILSNSPPGEGVAAL